MLIHELFHRTYYLASDAMFDESAANYVGSAGAVAFFAATDGESAPSTIAARGILDSDLKFARFLLQEQARLLDIYMANLPKEELDKRREAAFAAIKADYAALAPTLSGLERFDLDKQPLNNAVLVNYLIYFHQLDNFAALDRMNHGDLRATIAQIISIAKAHPDDPFYADLAGGPRSAPVRRQLGEQRGDDRARQFRFAAAEEMIGAGDDLESRRVADFRSERLSVPRPASTNRDRLKPAAPASMRHRGMRASAIASGSATATIRAISARSYPALSATIAPNEYPVITAPSLRTPGCASRNAIAATASSTSPGPPSCSPSLAPTPRKLKRNVAYPACHIAARIASTTLLYIEPP